MENKSVLNSDVLDEYAPALSEILDQIIKAGFNDIQLQLECLTNQDGNVSKVAMVRCAHSIKSCSAQIGGELLAHFALQKEQQYQAGQLHTLKEDIVIFSQMFEELKTVMAEALAVRGF